MRYRSGFTLLEVMLVLLLVGILASAVVMNFAGDSPQQKLEKETLRFNQAFQFIADTALLRQQEWGLVVAANQYAFVYFDGEVWQWVQEPAVAKAYTMPEGITLALQLEGLPGAEESLLSQLSGLGADETDATQQDASSIPPLPQVFMLSSGEVSPFRLHFNFAQDRQLQLTLGTDFSVPLRRFTEVN
ncbi:type II secretion system minor pseudopilin GspH [Alishewanella jeotgali]|uniref:Type II secretion system protein H n=1 Tax=Alishewanella jeotgali KCTC 22429 TaxID=1129374 RepID=H3ZF46_9ALTE|nr:type II secretion system minor pseudopilin GspH [Alishewanella jeotgali]EHR40864.1 general secretion pathway protein H [Alishewanella jeotgali KCTC 22429]